MKFTLPQRAAVELDPLPVTLFALLVFFLLPLIVAYAQQQERARLPQAAVARPPVPATEHLLLVRITDKGDVQIAGDDVPAGSLLAAFERERALLPAGLPAAQAGVLIGADRTAPGGRIQEVVKAAQQARFGKFLLQVRPAAAAAAPKKAGQP